MARVTVQQILQQGYAAFAQSQQLPGYVRKAVWALLACRTAVLGGHVQRCDNLLNKLGRQKWNVHIRERYPRGEGVLIYLARYVRGGPLANQRLVSCGQREVRFRYRVNGEGAARPRCGLLTLSITDFIRRYLFHVPEPGTKVVRGYGLYAPTKREALAVCRAQLGQGPVVQPAVRDWQTACQDRRDEHPERCPVCGRRLVCLGVSLPARMPPPSAIPWQVVA
jgi:hypothetical protein